MPEIGRGSEVQRGPGQHPAAPALRPARALSPAAHASLAAAVDAYLAETSSHAYRESPEGHRARAQLLTGRSQRSRRSVVPWIATALPLEGARILEIGCGTGSSTAALAEQGARVTAVDIDAAAIAVARTRCELYGLELPEFLVGNAIEILPKCTRGSFDLILFYACLEHMTDSERFEALRASWQLLTPGQLLGVVETPNRLWPMDDHTSQLPFFHWLPDALAFAYSQHSPRASVRDRYREVSESAMLEFLRRGRGVSFHEFELALAPIAELCVVSHLAERERRSQSWPRRLRARLRPDFEARFRQLLRERLPGLPTAFCEPHLDLLLRAGP